MRTRATASLVGLSAVAALCSGGAPARGETLADAIALAYQSNPNLQQQRAQLRGLDETYVQARAGWRPTVAAEVTAGYTRTPQTSLFGGLAEVASTPGTIILGASQPLYTGGRTAAAVRAAEADVLAARETLRGIEANLLQNVIAAYLDVLRDQMLLNLRERDISVMQGEVDDVSARLRAGDVTATDVAQVQTQLAQSRTALAVAEGQLQLSRANYAAVVGQNPGDLVTPANFPGLPPNVDEAFSLAEQSNPGLRQAEIAEEASRARIAEARAANRPALNLGAQVSYSGQLSPFYGNAFLPGVSVSVTLTQPLFSGGVNASNVRRAIELNNSDRIGIEASRRAAVLAVSAAWNQMITTRATVASEQEHVEVARRYFTGTQAEYIVGQRTTLDVIIAEQSLVNAEATLIAARHDALAAQAAVLNSVGRLEVRYLMPDAPLYEPSSSFRRVARSGSVPWEGAIAALDNLGAPSPGPARPLPAPNPATSPVIADGGDPIGPHPWPATASPTAPLPNTTSPNTPETVGRNVGPPQDSYVKGDSSHD